MDGSKIAAGFNVYDDDYYFQSAGVKIFSNQPEGSAGFVCQSTLNVGSEVLSVQFSPSGDIITAGCYDGTVQIIDVATAEVKRPLNVDSCSPVDGFQILTVLSSLPLASLFPSGLKATDLT